jgi:hypothetical protein
VEVSYNHFNNIDRRKAMGSSMKWRASGSGQRCYRDKAIGMDSMWAKTVDAWANALWQEEANNWAPRQEKFEI